MVGTIVLIAFVVAVAAILIVFGGPVVLAIIPLVIGGALIAVVPLLRRRRSAQSMKRFRDEADPHKTEFTARDRETQV